MPSDSYVDLRLNLSGWPNANEDGVRALFVAVYTELSQAFHTSVPVPIFLSWHDKKPETRSYSDRTEIYLHANGNLWSQFVYQAAHEVSHALIRDMSWETRWRTSEYRHKWFEEAICEMASYSVLSRFAESWQREPVDGLASFDCTKRYAVQHQIYWQNDAAKALPLPDDLPNWFQANEGSLTVNPCDRKLNAVISVILLPNFLCFPQLWRDCAHLNQWDTTHDETFEDYLKSWWAHMRSRNVHPQGVSLDVANFLGLDIGVRATGVASDSLKSMFPNLRVRNSVHDG